MSRFAELVECFDAAYITRQLAGPASPFAGFIFAMESYLEYRGRDCHAGRYRFMNNSSRNCLRRCAQSSPSPSSSRPRPRPPPHV